MVEMASKAVRVYAGAADDLIVDQPLQPQVDDLGLVGLTAPDTLQLSSAG